ncbi:MAG: MFS transporter [Gammaproteobacteria bacterium]
MTTSLLFLSTVYPKNAVVYDRLWDGQRANSTRDEAGVERRTLSGLRTLAAKIPNMLNRNLIVLFACQLLAATGAIVMVTLGGIIGGNLSDNPALATLPVSVWVVSMALTTVPAVLVMRRIGRPLGFSLASLSATVAVLVALWALQQASFWGYVFAAALFGINMAFMQQYRFAAIESVPAAYAARAVSWVLMGAVGGAMLGPIILRHSVTWNNDVPYAGTMLSLAALYLTAAALFLLLRTPEIEESTGTSGSERPLGDMIRQPVFIVAVLGGTIGYGVMTFVMTATPLSMHSVDGFSLDQTASVIRAHVFGMYLPSLVSGYLIDRLGVTRMMAAGSVVLVFALIVAMSGHSMSEYMLALVLLGVGWNFLYVGGTAMLTYTYKTEERFRAQAFNEFCVFGFTAIGSLLAGTIMYLFGWFTTVAAPVPILALIMVGLYVVRHDPLVAR